jgi:hypothetical protein
MRWSDHTRHLCPKYTSSNHLLACPCVADGPSSIGVLASLATSLWKLVIRRGFRRLKQAVVVLLCLSIHSIAEHSVLSRRWHWDCCLTVLNLLLVAVSLVASNLGANSTAELLEVVIVGVSHLERLVKAALGKVVALIGAHDRSKLLAMLLVSGVPLTDHFLLNSLIAWHVVNRSCRTQRLSSLLLMLCFWSLFLWLAHWLLPWWVEIILPDKIRRWNLRRSHHLNRTDCEWSLSSVHCWGKMLIHWIGYILLASYREIWR